MPKRLVQPESRAVAAPRLGGYAHGSSGTGWARCGLELQATPDVGDRHLGGRGRGAGALLELARALQPGREFGYPGGDVVAD